MAERYHQNDPDRVYLIYDQPCQLALAYREPRETSMPGRYAWKCQDGRMWFLSADEVADINIADLQVSETFWVTKKRGPRGQRARLVVSRENPRRGGGPVEASLDPDASDVARQTARSVDQIKQRVQTAKDARQNVERAPVPPTPAALPAAAPAPQPTNGKPAAAAPQFRDLVDSTLAQDAPAPARKGPQLASNGSGTPTQLEHALKTVLYACKQATAYAHEIDFQAPPFSSDDIARMAMTLVIGQRPEEGGRR